MVGSWISKGWEDYKKKWVTYAALEFLLLIVTALLAGGALLQGVLAGNAITTAEAILVALEAALINLVILLFVDIYLQLAILKTYATDGNLATVLKEAAKDYIPFLVAIIILGLAYYVPVWFFGVIGDLVGAKLALIAIGILVGLFLAIKLMTFLGRVAFGEDVRNALEKSWKTSFVDDLKVLAVLIGMAILAAVMMIIPWIGGLINIFVVFPLTAAIYMAAVEELRS